MTSSGYTEPPEFSTVDTVQKTTDKLVPNVHDQPFIDFEEAGRSIFDTQDEDYADTNFSEGSPENIFIGVTSKFTCDDSGGSNVRLPPGGVALWDPVTSVLKNLEQNAVYFVALRLNVKFSNSSAELQFTTFIEGGGLDPIVAANLAIEVPDANAFGLVQPIITFIAPAAAVGNDVRFDMKAIQGDASIAERTISVYKAFGPPTATITSDAENDEDLKANLSDQAYRNALFSLRTKFERLAVQYGDDRFDGPGGTFESYVSKNFLKFTVDGSGINTFNLVGQQKSPWDPINSQLINLQDNGVYLVTCYYQFKGSADNSAIFRIRDTFDQVVVSGSQTSEDATPDWETYGLTIYFTAPANAMGKTFEVDFWHNGSGDLGDRAVSVIQIA